MGGKSKAPPPPNYAPLAEASRQQAEYANEIAREQLDWAKRTYAEDKQVTDRVVDFALWQQKEQLQMANKDRQRYEQVFQPLENELVQDAAGYTDERNRSRAEAAAGRATADVSQQFQLARAAAQDRLESFGIDPSQTRAGALDVQTRIAEAAARAGAANVTREGTLRAEEATGRALRSEALNIGRGYPGQVQQAYGAALQAGQSGVQSGLAQTASGASTMGTGGQWMGISGNALGQWGNTLNTGFQNQMAGWKANQEQSSGWGQALGMLGGMALTAGMPGGGTAMGSVMKRFFKHGGVVPAIRLQEGGAVPALDTDQAPQGVQIDPSMSPSQGVNVDDVPAMLNADEFVIPADVLKWKGEEFFQKTIQKSREAKEQAPAKPQVMVQGVPITPVGNPAQEALAVG